MSGALPQVVITGTGLITSLGLDSQQTFAAVCAGRSAFRPLRHVEPTVPADAAGGEAPALPEDESPDAPREIRYLRRAIRDAWAAAHLAEGAAPAPNRTACLVGTTLHGMRAGGRFLRSGDFSQLKDFLASNVLSQALDGLPVGGLASTGCSACSSSLSSVALGVTLLQSGQYDLVIAGGYDAIGEYVWGGFNSLRLITPTCPRPFSAKRSGMKLAEGYGIVILEREADANRRNAPVIARVLGCGESADAHHLTQPDPHGNGAARAMRQALERAGLAPEQLGLIAAHATATPDNDAAEYAALSQLLGDKLPSVPVVAFKSHVGHTLGAAGAVELILSAMALGAGVVPPCANVSADEVEFRGLDLVTGEARKRRLDYSLNTSLGFGGANTCVVLGRANPQSDRPPVTTPPAIAIRPEQREVFITGIGVIFPGITGNDAFAAHIERGESPAWLHDAAALDPAQWEGLISARRVRRMSEYVKATLAATTLALTNAAVTDVAGFSQTAGAIVGTTHGSCSFCVAYYDQIVKEGTAAANPLLFAEGVPNSAAAQLSLMLSLKNSCQSVIGARSAGLEALMLATRRIASGEADRLIVSAGEEPHEIVSAAHRHCGQASPRGGPPFEFAGGFVLGNGAVSLILESRRSLESRGVSPRARVEAVAAHYADRRQAQRAVSQTLEQLGREEFLLSSACGGWIDSVEAAAITNHRPGATVSSIYGHLAETFSAGPLAGIAASLLRKKLPGLMSDARVNAGFRPALGTEPISSFSVVCTDFTGASVGARLRLL